MKMIAKMYIQVAPHNQHTVAMSADTKPTLRFCICFALRACIATVVTYTVFNADANVARWAGLVPLAISVALFARHSGILGRFDTSLLDGHRAWWGYGQFCPRLIHAIVNGIAACLILVRFSDLSAKVGCIIMLSDPLLGAIFFYTHSRETDSRGTFGKCATTQRIISIENDFHGDTDNILP